MVQLIQKKKLEKNRGIILFWLLSLVFSANTRANCPCNQADSSYYFDFTVDSTGRKGVFRIVDCSINLTVDSAQFDNTHNWNYYKIDIYFRNGPGCYAKMELNELTMYIWTLGPRVRRNSEGVLMLRNDTITGTEGYPYSYKNFSVGYTRTYVKDILIAEFFFNKYGLSLGLSRTYYDNGVPKYISYSAARGGFSGAGLTGPALLFHENGRIKRIRLIDPNGREVYDVQYNKWGLRIKKRNGIREELRKKRKGYRRDKAPVKTE